MRRSTFFSLIVASAAIWLPDSASAFVLLSGTTTGTFDNFVLSGNVINTNSSLGFYDNTATNFSFGSGTSAMGWGTNPGTSTLTFTGKPFAVGLGQTFDIGTLTYFNGTSDLTSLIFGATLTLGAGAGVDPLAASFQIITTRALWPDRRRSDDDVRFRPAAGRPTRGHCAGHPRAVELGDDAHRLRRRRIAASPPRYVIGGRLAKRRASGAMHAETSRQRPA